MEGTKAALVGMHKFGSEDCDWPFGLLVSAL